MVKKEEDVYVHSTATIDKPCLIGKGTKIWHYCHVMSGARIGEGCQLGQNVFVSSGGVIGNGVKIQNNVSIYDGVELGDDVFCGPSMVFTNVMNPRSHICRRNEYRPTKVGRGVTFGANCTIVCGLSVGEFAFVGAGSVVTKDVPPHALVYGNPAKISGWMCECGVKLEVSVGSGKCGACGKVVRLENV